MEDRHPVRQAGALWAIACMQRFRPSTENLLAIRRALRFYAINTETGPTGFEYFVAPGQEYGQTGTMALLCLALSELLRSDSELSASERDGYKTLYKHYIEFLLTLQNDAGHFHRQYDHKDGVGFGPPSPYYDGEGLLALTHAAKYHGFADLREMILKVVYSMYNANVKGPTSVVPDNERTKGFYQWGSMAFYELLSSDWSGASKNDLAKWTISMGHWMIDTHDVMNKTGNTSYAFEGLLCARQTALMTGDLASMRKFDAAADISLPRLITLATHVRPAPCCHTRRTPSCASTRRSISCTRSSSAENTDSRRSD
jgi:UDP-N-acetylmuramoyl-tripeptide--D-alanyl-D-alanine ligase